ncbi:Translation initiation factor IF-2, isoform beta [Buchnera aphidicola (Tuberolachnus salignus)]|uniref:Translation initiation factor IF-2 n=2 Tax=Buchnera aphidicola TaxID=9 RepID=A0A160SXJ6_BUCTT|nr:Translation initiation factor IF-2, isoform beta [Buchnera aphidicola (Tuberolachnus salignus)]
MSNSIKNIKEKKKKKSKNKKDFLKNKTIITKISHVKEKNNDIKRRNSIKNLKNLKFRKYHKKNDKKYLVKEDLKLFYARKNSKKNILLNSSLRQKFKKPKKNIYKTIHIGFLITISELANRMSVKKNKVVEIITQLELNNISNDILDQETAQLISEEMGYKVILHLDNKTEFLLLKNRNINHIQKILPRAPIVTIMGHVDHGKTSLLDKICSTKVVNQEFGGITQHIGAYSVFTKNGKIIFIDTPGHSAFTAMRARGAQITDIIILVIAVDDGVMPQTIEAIKHAFLAKVPIIVAINKIDKSENNINHIKKDLLKYEIISEDFGGETMFIPVSAKTGKGLKNLLQAILLQAEMLELKSDYEGMATGVVIESFLDKGYGPTVSIIILEGCLKKGDVCICGMEYGKIRVIHNENRQEITKASPSMPVLIYGLSGLPRTGEKLIVVKNEKKAREVSIYRKFKLREKEFLSKKQKNIENLFQNLKKDTNKILNIVLKADTYGSLEAILDSISNLTHTAFEVNILSSGIGAITETDVSLSINTRSILIGFNVRADLTAKRIIEIEKLDLRYYSIIYNLLDDIKLCLKGLSTPIKKQEIIGLAEVRSIFKSPKFGLIAGCIVINGLIKKTNPIRILRNNVVIYEGVLESLRRFKEDVLEVRTNIECGIGIKNYHSIQIGDQIEVFKILS